MKRTPITRNPDAIRDWQQRTQKAMQQRERETPKLRRPLPQQSAKARNDALALSKIKKEMLRNDPRCRRCGIEAPLDLHHRAGRCGHLVTFEPLLTVLCRACHSHCKDEPAAMLAEGWIVSRFNSEERE